MDPAILGFLLGFSIGGIIQSALYKHWVIAEKAKHGTAEYIRGKAHYIITDEDWKILEACRSTQRDSGDIDGP